MLKKEHWSSNDLLFEPLFNEFRTFSSYFCIMLFTELISTCFFLNRSIHVSLSERCLCVTQSSLTSFMYRDKASSDEKTSVNSSCFFNRIRLWLDLDQSEIGIRKTCDHWSKAETCVLSWDFLFESRAKNEHKKNIQVQSIGVEERKIETTAINSNSMRLHVRHLHYLPRRCYHLPPLHRRCRPLRRRFDEE